MGSDLLKEGGPHNIKRVGPSKYNMTVKLPTDEGGLTGRECPSPDCSPAYFKVKPGTGITSGQAHTLCPYCGHKGDPSDFHTKAQIQYAKDILTREATDGIERELKNALGIGPSGIRKIGGGFLSLEISLKPGSKPPIRRPYEEVLRRDLVCAHCGLVHSVFGIATWCPDCGADIFLEHVRKEYDVVKLILADVDNRAERLGARVAARDVENALEDTLSIFEAVLRAVTKRKLLLSKPSEEVDQIMNKNIGNRYQSVTLASGLALEYLGVTLFESLTDEERSLLSRTFEKRHPITHNLGVVDRKYLERVQSGELEGREIRVSAEEVTQAAEFSLRVISNVHATVFPITQSE